jgi:hypothetical protein
MVSYIFQILGKKRTERILPIGAPLTVVGEVILMHSLGCVELYW